MSIQTKGSTQAIVEIVLKGVFRVVWLLIRLLWRGLKILFRKATGLTPPKLSALPEDPEQLLTMMETASEQRDFPVARGAARKLLSLLDPRDANLGESGPIHLGRAYCHFQLWHAEDALDPEPNPASFDDSRAWKAKACRRLEKLRPSLEDAAKEVEMALASRPAPENAAAGAQLIHSALARNLSDSDQHVAAYSSFRRSIACAADPSSIEDFANVGAVAARAGQIADFEGLAEALIERCPGGLELRRGAANAYWGAAIDIDEAKASPENLQLRSRLLSRAVAHMRVVTDQTPDANALFMLGRIQYALESDDGAAALDATIRRLQEVERDQPLRDPREIGLPSGMEVRSRAEYLSRLLTKQRARLSSRTPRIGEQPSVTPPPVLTPLPPIDMARTALDEFSTACTGQDGHPERLLELADAADDACFQAVKSAPDDGETFRVQVEGFGCLDPFVRQLATSTDSAMKCALAKRLAQRAERRLMVQGGMVWHDAGMRFEWVTLLQPDNGDAFHRAGMCLFTSGKWAIEDDSDFPRAKNALLSAREYLDRASQLMPNSAQVSDLLARTDALLQRC